MTYTLFNKTEQNDAVARNVSRSGIYFETTRMLSPGMLVVIRKKDDTTSENFPPYDNFQPKGDVIHPGEAVPEPCSEMKMQVVGEVKRCVTVEEGDTPCYGVAVRYLIPAV